MKNKIKIHGRCDNYFSYWGDLIDNEELEIIAEGETWVVAADESGLCHIANFSDEAEKKQKIKEWSL